VADQCIFYNLIFFRLCNTKWSDGQSL